MAAVRPLPVVLALTALGIGCASAGDGEPRSSADGMQLPERYTVYFRADAAPHTTVLEAPLERVAALVPGAYQYMGLVVGPATSTDQLTFLTPNLRINGRLYEGERNSEYLDCGNDVGGNRADVYEVTFAAYTRLKEGQNGTTIVETLVGGTARSRLISSGTVTCRGTGKFEKAIAELLRSRTARG